MYIGSSESGKSYLLKHHLTQALSQKDDAKEKKFGLKFGIVFTATKHTGAYNWLPDKHVFSSFNSTVLMNYLKWLGNTAAKKKKPIPNNFIVFDDIVNSLPQREKWFEEFLSTYRHYNITLFVTTQYINKCAALFREQASYAYIFQLFTAKAIEAAYDSYGTLFRTRKAWQTHLEAGTSVKHQCVVWKKASEPVLALKYSTFKAPECKSQKKFEY